MLSQLQPPDRFSGSKGILALPRILALSSLILFPQGQVLVLASSGA